MMDAVFRLMRAGRNKEGKSMDTAGVPLSNSPPGRLASANVAGTSLKYNLKIKNTTYESAYATPMSRRSLKIFSALSTLSSFQCFFVRSFLLFFDNLSSWTRAEEIFVRKKERTNIAIIGDCFGKARPAHLQKL